VIEPAEEVAAPIGQLDDPRRHPFRMERHPQRVHGRLDQFGRHAHDENLGATVAVDHVPVAIDHQSRVGLEAGQQPGNRLTDERHATAVVVQRPGRKTGA
jgi:hypothetical protein